MLGLVAGEHAEVSMEIYRHHGIKVGSVLPDGSIHERLSTGGGSGPPIGHVRSDGSIYGELPHGGGLGPAVGHVRSDGSIHEELPFGGGPGPAIGHVRSDGSIHGKPPLGGGLGPAVGRATDVDSSSKSIIRAGGGAFLLLLRKRHRTTTENVPGVKESLASVSSSTLPGDSEAQLYERLLRERIIVLRADVDDAAANRICAEILLLSADDSTRDIWLYIDSPGGSVTAGMAIYDMMEYVPNDICTVAMGMAAGMGQFLLCAGASGKRFALRDAKIVVTLPRGGGSAASPEAQAAQMDYVKRTLVERIAYHTGQSIERIETDGGRERIFTAESACEYGLVDAVVRKAR
ncbi:ATP-dependent Clp protease proteolytic subunit [Nonomuraea sp. NPDC050394]|uniref:ATP-dependent Clp protease proteolytic subunit n=1 Tax=Nonomuraea sp. NPDC050394 TaxID=3364363 RepID=UPI0037B12E95